MFKAWRLGKRKWHENRDGFDFMRWHIAANWDKGRLVSVDLSYRYNGHTYERICQIYRHRDGVVTFHTRRFGYRKLPSGRIWQ